MKKNIIALTIVVTFFSFFCINKVSAASGSAYLTGASELLAGEEGYLTLGFNGSSNVAGVQYKIVATGDIEIVGVTTANDEIMMNRTGSNPSFSVLQAPYSIEGISSGKAWASIRVRMLSGASVGSQGTITISEISLSLDETENTTYASNVSKTITVVSPPTPTQPANNNQNSNQDNQNVETVAKVVSSKLKELKINNIEEFIFDPEVFEYNINGNSEITSLEIETVTEEDGAIVEIEGNEEFKLGENIVTIKVIASDNSESIYKIIVNILDDDEYEEIRNNNNNASCRCEQKIDNEKLVWIVISCTLAFALLFETAYIIFDKRKRQY